MDLKTYSPGVGVIPGRRRSQQLVVEAVNILVAVDQTKCSICRGTHYCVFVDVAAQAAWICAGSIRPWILGYLGAR